MVYLEHRPAPPLDEFVKAFWYCEGYQPAHRRERVLPHGAVQVVIDLARSERALPGDDTVRSKPADVFSPASVAGVHTEFMVIETASLQKMIGIQFLPGGSVPFFDVPTDELSDRHVPLESLWGAEAGEVRERLLAAGIPAAQFKVLETSLAGRASGRWERHPAVAYALREFQSVPHALTVGDVIQRIGLSPRRFADVFRRETGVTPKLYCRIRRFHAALRQIAAGHEVDWADVALACGYFDQAHFVHEFRAFSGISPTGYLAGRRTWVNHVALTD